MAEEVAAVSQEQQIYAEIGARIRDLEDKQRLLKDRTLLIGQSLIDERDKTFKEIQEMKKDVIKLKDENARLKDFVQRMSEQIGNMARKEELMILQRQFDLFRGV